MSTNLPKKRLRRGIVALAILLGIIGWIGWFAAGSFTGSTGYGIMVAGAWFLVVNSLLAKWFPHGRWYYSLLVAAPVGLPLIIFVILARMPLVETLATMVAVAIAVAAAYLGTFFGTRLSAMRPTTGRLIFAASVSLLIVVLVVMFSEVQRPRPLPDDKQAFVGTWRSDQGFELGIEADGTVQISGNIAGGRDTDVLLAQDAGARLRAFVSDTALDVEWPGVHWWHYHIDREPYRDSLGEAMVLNDVTLRRQP